MGLVTPTSLILPEQISSKKWSWGTFFLRMETTQQRTFATKRVHPSSRGTVKTRCSIRSRIRTRRIILWCTGCDHDAPDPDRNGMAPTTNRHTCGQFHCVRSSKQHDQETTIASDEHALFLDRRPSKLKKYPCTVGTRIRKFVRLFYKTPFGLPSSKCFAMLHKCA